MTFGAMESIFKRESGSFFYPAKVDIHLAQKK